MGVLPVDPRSLGYSASLEVVLLDSRPQLLGWICVTIFCGESEEVWIIRVVVFSHG